MSDHYYSKQPQSVKKTETHTFTIKNHPFKFTTSSGVFSKKGIDFGSRTLIEFFEPPNIAGGILDLGCGYGPIGLAIGKSYPDRSITMVDINERAVEMALENAEQNDIRNADIKVSDGFRYVTKKTFAAIVTNPPIRAGKKVIYQMFKESMDYLVDQGELWIVVQKKQGAPSMMTYLATLFQEVTIITRQKGYVVIRAKTAKS